MAMRPWLNAFSRGPNIQCGRTLKGTSAQAKACDKSKGKM